MLHLNTFDQEVNIYGIRIQPKKCFAFLGVLVDDHVYFSDHIDYLVVSQEHVYMSLANYRTS